MKQYLKKMVGLFTVMMMVGVVVTGGAASAKSAYDSCNNNLIVMKCDYEWSGTILHGTIASNPGCSYLYVYPTGLYKHGKKTLTIWPSTGPASSANIRYASTSSIVTGTRIFNGKCEYKYGKSKRNHKTHIIYMD